MQLSPPLGNIPSPHPSPIPASTLRSLLARQVALVGSVEAVNVFGALIDANAQTFEAQAPVAAQDAPASASPTFMTRDQLRAELEKIRARLLSANPQE